MFQNALPYRLIHGLLVRIAYPPLSRSQDIFILRTCCTIVPLAIIEQFTFPDLLKVIAIVFFTFTSIPYSLQIFLHSPVVVAGGDWGGGNMRERRRRMSAVIWYNGVKWTKAKALCRGAAASRIVYIAIEYTCPIALCGLTGRTDTGTFQQVY